MTENTHKLFLFIGCLSCFLAVLLGAFGAHMLKSRLSEYALNVFEVGVRYQFYHGLALILFALCLKMLVVTTVWPGYSFIAGTVVFSGSLYVLALSGIKVFGAITPLGGVAFLVGWVTWMASLYSSR